MWGHVSEKAGPEKLSEILCLDRSYYFCSVKEKKKTKTMADEVIYCWLPCKMSYPSLDLISVALHPVSNLGIC